MFRIIVLFFLLACLLSPLVLLTQVIDSTPLAASTHTPDSSDAKRTKALLKRSWQVLKQDRRTELTVMLDDLNAAIAFVGRGSSYLAGNFALEQEVLSGNLTLKIPSTPFGEYLNVKIRILPSEQGLRLADCRLGNLTIPGDLALFVVKAGLDLLGEEQLGSQLLATIDNVSFGRDRLLIGFQSGTRFAALKTRLLARLKEFKTDQASDHELAKIEFYLQHLDSLNLSPLPAPISLDQFIVPLFQQARQQSRQSSAEEENRAALYALAIYLGGRDFRKLSDYLLNPEKPFRYNRRVQVVLAERRDLLKHFLVSAGLKLLSDAQMGFAVGEFKELLDANKGGSGFSFIDLAADRSGLRFAELATGSEQQARQFQQRIDSVAAEKDLFPDFQDLAEGLNQKQFIDQYGNIDSERYQDVVKMIDRRLVNLPLYQ